MAFYEQSKRSVTKSITYRILIIISTFIIVFISTGDYSTTIEVTTVSTIVSTVIYYLHERIWNNIHWGKREINQ